MTWTPAPAQEAGDAARIVEQAGLALRASERTGKNRVTVAG